MNSNDNNMAIYLYQIRNCTPPSRNGLSHANAKRNPKIAEDLFWKVFANIKNNILISLLIVDVTQELHGDLRDQFI